MGIFFLLVAVDPVMIQKIDTYTGAGVKDVPVIEDYSHVDYFALFVVKKGQVTLLNFRHEVDGAAQFSLLLTVTGDVLPHHPAD